MTPILLDRNENPYGPSPACYECLKHAPLEHLTLYSRHYLRGTKSELSERLGQILHIPEEQVLLSYGSEDMLKQIVHCYLHAGETLLLPQHSWWYYKALAGEVSGRHVEYACRERGHRFAYDTAEILHLYDTHRPRIILIPSPNNPTGNSIAREDLTTILSHCRDSVLVLDEAYAGFNGEADAPSHTLLENHPRVAVLRTFSKLYALAGLRIGYACIGRDLGSLEKFSARYLGYNRLSEKVALAALADEEYYARIAAWMREDKERYYEEFSGFDGFTAFSSDANFLLVRYPDGSGETLSSGLRTAGITIKFLKDPGLDDCLRITIGTREQNAAVRSALRRIMEPLGQPVPPATGRT